ncbi:PREDICTED: uncharacterized protein LOC104590888 [Nelumbo nucifera]|uniref:Uncharacterized protein LOC104590888 n=1 Tax=Nelumbo nucifera TaxID=4432 RepID=A0A1U8Q272_NELNU|nr:PREDICTED: uncharacterized protein LOC104590888 [Nelumbo nucifera]
MMNREQASECGGCDSEDRWILHNVRHRGIYRRLCTSCVLKFHGGLFCPHCYEVYEGSIPPHERVLCLKCPSVAHLACVGLDKASRYVCPPCLNSSFLFFDVPKKTKGGDGKSVSATVKRAFDQKSAKVLLASARIAAVSMSKAAAAARIEAEKRVKEAALTKKRAREALERVAFLVGKEKERGKEMTLVPRSVPVSEQRKKSKGYSAVAATVAAHKRIQDNLKAGGNDKPGGIPVNLNNNIASREKDRWARIRPPSVVQMLPKNGISVDDRDKQKASSAPVIVRQQLQNTDAVNEHDRSGSISNFQSHTMQREKGNNGICSVPAVVGQHQNPPKSNGLEEDKGKSS